MNSSSSWEQIIFGVSQGSVFRPILFNIFFSVLFSIFGNIDIASDADDITFYKARENVDAAAKTLIMSTKKLFRWFKDNEMKGNTGKCYSR